jgi:hypothetical protein
LYLDGSCFHPCARGQLAILGPEQGERDLQHEPGDLEVEGLKEDELIAVGLRDYFGKRALIGGMLAMSSPGISACYGRNCSFSLTGFLGLRLVVGVEGLIFHYAII